MQYGNETMYINVHNACNSCNCTVFWWLLLTDSLALDAFCNYIHTLETLIEPYHQFSHKFTEQRLCVYIYMLHMYAYMKSGAKWSAVEAINFIKCFNALSSS